MLSKMFLAVGLAVAVPASVYSESSIANHRYPGDYLHRLTTDFETPHFRWGKPLEVGPLDALFFSHRRFGAREIIELAQRVDLTFEAVVGVNFSTLSEDNIYESRVQGTARYEKNAEVRRKLARSYPLYVFANFSFSALDEEAQYRILKQVSEGSGLVIVYPHQFPFQKLFAQKTDDATRIMAGLDTAALPGAGLTLPGDGAPLKTYQFGKGRVAVLDYQNPAFGAGLTSYAPYQLSKWAAQYENSLALAARTLQWAAGGDPKVEANLELGSAVAGAPFSASFRLSGTDSGEVQLRLRDSWNREVWKTSEVISEKQILTFPALEGGEYFLDYLWLKAGKVQEFGVLSLPVASEIGALEVKSSQVSYEQGEPVSAVISWQTPLEKDAIVTVSVEDLPDRNLRLEKRVEVKAGALEVAVPLGAANIPTLAALIRAEISIGKQTIAGGYSTAYFPRRKLEDYPTIIWGSIPPELAPMYAQIVEAVTPNAIATAVSDPAGETAKRSALFNQRFSPQASIVSIAADDAGQTKARFWLTPLDKDALDQAAGDDASFYNPNVQAHLREMMKRYFEPLLPLGPTIYNLGDENNYSYEAGYTSSDEKAYRAFLQEEYGSIAELNRLWGTTYASFDAVAHPRPAEMRERSLFPQWYAHRRFMEKQFADAHHFLADEIRKLDPHAMVGAEGTPPGEMERTLSKLDYWGPYTDPIGDELLRSIAPEKLRTIWWGYGGEYLAYPLWKPLLSGTANGNTWYSASVEAISGYIAADFSIPAYYRDERKPFVDALNRGAAHLMIHTPLRKDGIAVLWSHASYSASFMDEQFFNPRDASAALTDFFYREGLNFDYLTSSKVESGALDDYKLLFLPGASALSAKEISTIMAFVERGGTVIADLNPGVMNAACLPLEKSRLAELFGTPDLKGKEALKLRPVHIDREVDGVLLKFQAAKAQQSPEVPVLTVHTFGKGRAILLNFNLSSAINSAETPMDSLLVSLLKLGGIEPPVATEGLAKEKLIVRGRKGDGFELIGVLVAPEDIGKTSGTLRLPKAGWVYEVDRGLISPQGATQEISLNLEIPFRLYSIFDQPQSAPQLKLFLRLLQSAKR